MFFSDFFSPKDKVVKDRCPICQTEFGSNYLKTERLFFCDDCGYFWDFHPYDTIPKAIKKKKDSHLNEEPSLPSIPEDFDPEDLDYPDDPPPTPRFPPWW